MIKSHHKTDILNCFEFESDDIMDELTGDVNDSNLMECFDDNLKKNAFYLLKQTINVKGLIYFIKYHQTQN